MLWQHVSPRHCKSWDCWDIEESAAVEWWSKKTRFSRLPRYRKKYTSATGGVDLADMLIILYHTPYKTMRCYLWVVVHLLDVCKVIAWLLYWRFANLMFTSKTAYTLIYRGKPINDQRSTCHKRKWRNVVTCRRLQLLKMMFFLIKLDIDHNVLQKRKI